MGRVRLNLCKGKVTSRFDMLQKFLQGYHIMSLLNFGDLFVLLKKMLFPIANVFSSQFVVAVHFAVCSGALSYTYNLAHAG